jgi:hypothetical protein
MLEINEREMEVLVNWDLDEGDISPPKLILVDMTEVAEYDMDTEEEAVTEWLSDNFGWCVNGWCSTKELQHWEMRGREVANV